MSSQPGDEIALLRRAVVDIKTLRARITAMESAKTEPIAVVGLGCRLPGGADDPAAFWRLLEAGVDAVDEVPAERWDSAEYYDPDPDVAGKMSTRWCSALPAVDLFDPAFFGISPREAEAMDPQQRLLLEVCWEALEDAGISAQGLVGSDTAVFVGISQSDYLQLNLATGDPTRINTYTGTGGGLSVAAGRLSYTLGLQGPSVAVDTACSSSLVAVHLAMRSLRGGECRTALAGGVNLVLSPAITMALSKLRMMATDGRCKTFDAAADGFVRGEGCGVVVLKRLSDAQADGDRIVALLRGSAVNQDGRSSGLTAPNGPSQEAVIRRALADGGVDPGELSYVEAHGTGTALGDPIEIHALASVFGPARGEKPLIVGSVKTNLGHLESAAGITGLIKTLLALEHGRIPPHLHFQRLNPHISTAGLKLQVPTEPTPWPAEKRVAGVSSFGFSGTNAHVVVEAAPVAEATPSSPRALEVLCLSAADAAARRQLAARYARHLQGSDGAQLADTAFTAALGRSHLTHRAAVLAASPSEAAGRWTAIAAGEDAPGLFTGTHSEADRPEIVFLFTGQGAQRPGMGRQLDDSQPVYRQALDRCEEALRDHLDRPLRSVLYPPNGSEPCLDQTAYTQPALFAVEYALAELWRSWGIEPAAVLGHSVGEITAACVAGVLTLEAAAKLVATRGRLMQELPAGGAMAVLFTGEERARAAIATHAARLAVAAINAPDNTVISGAGEAVDSVLAEIEAKGVDSRRLNVSHAFHSPLMAPMLDAFERAAAEIPHAEPQIDWISNLDGRVIGPETVIDAGYWRRHAARPVRFAAGIETLRRQGFRTFLEIGPHPALSAMARRSTPDGEALYLPSLRRGREDTRQVLESLAALYVHGVEVDWAAFYRGEARRRVRLPIYPFQRQRYWIDTSRPRLEAAAAGATGHPLLGQQRLSAGREMVFESRLRHDALDYLVDHRLLGAVVLPFAGHVELGLAAARQALGEGPWAVEELRAEEALVFPEGQPRTVQLVLVPDGDGATFTISSLDESGTAPTWARHAAGTCRRADGTAEEMALEALRARCSEELDVDVFYRKREESGLVYGPELRGIERLWRGEDEGLARLRRTASVAATEDAYELHPALTDACLQTVGAVLGEDGDAYLPVRMERARLYGGAGTELWSHARLRPAASETAEPRVVDLRLIDDSGRVAAELFGLHLRRLSRQQLLRLTREARADACYEIEWRRTALAGEACDQPPGSWLLLADETGLAVRLAEKLRSRGEHCRLVYTGDPATPGDGERVDPASPEALERLLAEAAQDPERPCGTIVHLWSLPAPGSAEIEAEALEREYLSACSGVLHTLQSLVRTHGQEPPRLCLVTRGAQATGGGPPVAAVQTALWGLGRTIRLEYPEVSCLRLDLDPVPQAGEAEDLFQELWAGDGEDQVALRDGRRHVPRLVARTASPAASPQLRGDVCYLITGGLGALGLRCARYLAERGARHLVLVGRREPGEAARQTLEEIAGTGARIRVLQADVSRPEDVARILAAAEEEAPVGGIVHCAAVLDDGTLLGLDRSRFAAVMAPKVLGAWHLHQLTLDRQLDFFVLFSSIAALFGAPGQGNYAAASAFLDGLAHHRRARGLPALSIDWGPWAEAGLADELESRGGGRWSKLGIPMMAPAEGVEHFGRLLGETSAQVAVLPGIDWRVFAARIRGGAPLPLLADLDAGRPAEPATEEAGGARLLDQLQAAPANERLALLRRQVGARVAAVLGMPSSQPPDEHKALLDMGLDSLTAIDLARVLRSATGHDFSPTTLYSYPTIHSLAEHIGRDVLVLDLDGGPARPAAAPEGEAGDLEALSHDEVEDLLEQELATLEQLGAGG